MSKATPYDWLVDSAAFVALHYVHDPHHARALQLFEQAKKRKISLVTTSYVVGETATVLSHRQGQDIARRFLEIVRKIPTIFISEALHQESLLLFHQQDTRGTSVVDCSNVVVMTHFGIPKILSFDGAFTKIFGQQAA